MDRWAKEGARRLENLAQMNCTKGLSGHSRGMSGIEVIIALGILGLIGVVFLGSLSTALKVSYLADEKSVAESLAQSEMEYVKSQDYEDAPWSYNTSSNGYTIQVAADALNNPDDGIQRITVIIYHDTKEVLTLEDYKVDRD